MTETPPKEPLRVGVLGARGRMGSETCRAVDAADDLDLVAMVEAGDWLFGVADAGAQVGVTDGPKGVVVNPRNGKAYAAFPDLGIVKIVSGVSGCQDARQESSARLPASFAEAHDAPRRFFSSSLASCSRRLNISSAFWLSSIAPSRRYTPAST